MSANGAWRLARYAAPVLSRIAILVTLIACGEHDTERMTAIKSKVCACKTASCAEQEMKLVPEQQIKSTPRTQVIARDMMDCTARLQEAERPSTDPDEEGAEPPAGEPSETSPPAPSPAAPSSAPPAIAPPAIAPPKSAAPKATPPTR
jgi:hypothetical protein